MVIGFTGTRKRMTIAQQNSLTYELYKALLGHSNIAHHGGAIGADVQFHECIGNMVQYVVVHPRNLPHSGPLFPAPDRIYHPIDPLQRNKNIVDSVQCMFATPNGYKNVPRGSGTWMTIRYATKQRRPLVIIFPDGSMTFNRGSHKAVRGGSWYETGASLPGLNERKDDTCLDKKDI